MKPTTDFMAGFTKSLGGNLQKSMIDAPAEERRLSAIQMKEQNLARFRSQLATDENIRKEGATTEENIRKEGVTSSEAEKERQSREDIAGVKDERAAAKAAERKNEEANKFAANYGYEPGSPEFAASVQFFLDGSLPPDFPPEKEKGFIEKIKAWWAGAGKGPEQVEAGEKEAPSVFGKNEDDRAGHSAAATAELNAVKSAPQLGPISDTGKPAPAAPAAAQKGGPKPQDSSKMGGEVAQPKTKADFDKLPSGAIYIDPKSGKQFKKP